MHVKEKPAAWDPGSSVGFWVKRVAQVLVKAQDQRLRAWGMSVSQLAILHALERGAASQRALAQAVGVEQPTMAVALGRLERAGIVERRRDPNDKRGTLTTLTEAARPNLEVSKQALVDLEMEATHGLSDAEKATLVALLRRVLGNLEKPRL